MPDQETNLPPNAETVAAEFCFTPLATTFCAISGIFLPILCFAIGFPERPEWQSGAISDYAKLFLSRIGSLPFYPLLLYNIISLFLLLYRPDRFVRNFFVGFGVYNGVIVAVGFWIVFFVAFEAPDVGLAFVFLTIIASLPPIIIWCMVYLSKRYPWAAVISSILAAICLLAIPVVFYIALIFSTPWAVACYTYVSWRIMRHRKNQGFQFSLAQLLGAVTWFGGYCSAWRVAYLIVLEEYSRLPTQAPQECYICTAAARGHRRFVCSEEYRTNSGTIRLVNDQLRRFKAFELLLRTIYPRLHRFCRKIYDAVGPLAARAIARPLPADFAYVTLKPLEWLCLAAVGLAAKDRSISDNLYRIR